MHPQYLFPADFIRSVDQHLTIKSTRPQQCRIENFRPVGGGENDYAHRGVKAVQFGQQLVQRLFAFIMPPRQGADPAHTTQRIQFVDKNNRRRLTLGLLKQIPNPGCTNTDKHLDKFRTTDGEERHTGLTGNGAGNQRLAGTRRTYQQYPLGNMGAQAAISPGLF